jgi:hypothetical protein
MATLKNLFNSMPTGEPEEDPTAALAQLLGLSEGAAPEDTFVARGDTVTRGAIPEEPSRGSVTMVPKEVTDMAYLRNVPGGEARYNMYLSKDFTPTEALALAVDEVTRDERARLREEELKQRELDIVSDMDSFKRKMADPASETPMSKMAKAIEDRAYLPDVPIEESDDDISFMWDTIKAVAPEFLKNPFSPNYSKLGEAFMSVPVKKSYNVDKDSLGLLAGQLGQQEGGAAMKLLEELMIEARKKGMKPSSREIVEAFLSGRGE